MDSQSLAGAVTLVADKDKVLEPRSGRLRRRRGEASRWRTDALFWIASQSKPITAAALMMLVDEGKVKLDDPVEKYLPEFKDQWWSPSRTRSTCCCASRSIRSPSATSSATPAACRSPRPWRQPTLDLLPLRDARAQLRLTPLQFEPGSKYQYSNAGINTAGRIIEVVSGMPYEEFLDKRLFGPLGMKDTTFWPKPAQLARLAKSYKANKDKTGPGRDAHQAAASIRSTTANRQPMPAGGLFSTAATSARFCQMILNGGDFEGKRYLSEAAVKEMTSKQTGDALKDGYGFGSR